jgi:hypothetical protein
VRRPRSKTSQVVIVVFSLLVLISIVLSLVARPYPDGGTTPTPPATSTHVASGALAVCP